MGRLPLEGIRVMDFSWIIAGPTATRYLAMMGAEVIKVGSARRPDPSSRGAPFQAYNQSKLYCSLNIASREGIELAKRLIAVADVLVENFAVGVFERLGLGYDSVRPVKPDLVMVSTSGTGHTGPDKDFVAYGSLLQYYTGWNSLSGYPDREPIRGGLWADPWVGLELAMVVAAALNHRVVTGEGQYVDFSMAEALSASMPEAILHYQMKGKEKQPMGNRDDWAVPHGVYPCLGSDRWVAIAVTCDEEWQALCRAMRRDDLVREPRFANPEDRRHHREELDSVVAGWTASIEDYEAMRLLQESGVPSGPSLDIQRVFQEPQLREGGYFSNLRTSDGELRDLPRLPWRFEDGTESQVTPAPVLGQHNEYIYLELLGLSQKELGRLVDDNVIY